MTQKSFDCKEALIQDYVMESAPLIYLVFDLEGRLIKSNEFARSHFSSADPKKHLTDVFIDFEGMLDLKALAKQQNPVPLTLNTPRDLAQTFYFEFHLIGAEYIALGHPDHHEFELVQRNLHDVSQQLSNANRSLAKKNAELETLNKLKNHFIGMAAHDLRSPIGQIMTSSEFLLDELPQDIDEELFDFLQIIHSTSQFMLTLIDQILDINAIESGKLNLNIQQTDLIALIKKNVHLNGLLAVKKGINLGIDSALGNLEMPLDGLKMEQVMNNLISNAIKFSPPGSSVNVELTGYNGEVTVAVKDEGPGIPEKDIDKLFKPFGRTSVAPSGGESSTGLGLAITKSIINGHKGKLWVESQPGHGAVFYFSLPKPSPQAQTFQEN